MTTGILDTLPANQRKRRANGELFARLLHGPAEGHALFHPCEEGTTFDCGYIETGSFTRLFNACDPPPGIDRFEPSLSVGKDLRINSGHILQSSATRSIAFKASLTDNLFTTGIAILPPDKHPLEISPEITRSSDDFAFLAFAGSQREVDTVKMPDRIRLRNWFVHNSERILDEYSMPAMQVIFKCVKSAGWVGGVAHHLRSTTTASIVGRFSQFVRTDMTVESASDVDTGMVNTRGPPRGAAWTDDAPRDYTIVVEYIQIKRTPKWLNRLSVYVASAARALFRGKTSRKQEDGMANRSGVRNAGEHLPRSNAEDVAAAAVDDMGPDCTALSAIMEKAGQGAQDDETIVVASSEIVQDYRKAYNVDPDPEFVRYDLERVPISNGRFALRVVRLHRPENIQDIYQKSACGTAISAHFAAFTT